MRVCCSRRNRTPTTGDPRTLVPTTATALSDHCYRCAGLPAQLRHTARRRGLGPAPFAPLPPTAVATAERGAGGYCGPGCRYAMVTAMATVSHASYRGHACWCCGRDQRRRRRWRHEQACGRLSLLVPAERRRRCPSPGGAPGDACLKNLPVCVQHPRDRNRKQEWCTRGRGGGDWVNFKQHLVDSGRSQRPRRHSRCPRQQHTQHDIYPWRSC